MKHSKSCYECWKMKFIGVYLFNFNSKITKIVSFSLCYYKENFKNNCKIRRKLLRILGRSVINEVVLVESNSEMSLENLIVQRELLHEIHESITVICCECILKE